MFRRQLVAVRRSLQYHIRRKRVGRVAKKLVKKFGEHNLRRPFSFGVSESRRDWYERNADRLDRLFKGKSPWKSKI